MNEKTKTEAMIVITPSSDAEAWNTWFAYYQRINPNRALTMLACVHDGRPFHVWTRMPPPLADPRNVRPPAPPSPAALDEKRLHNGAHFVGNIDEVAERIERRAAIEAEDAKAVKQRTRSHATREGRLAEAFTQVAGNQRPSIDDVDDIGVIEAIDPYELAEVYEGKRDPAQARPRAKLASLRDDPIGQMAKRGQIEEVQLEAARRWQAWHDTAQIGGVRGLNPFEVAVDGGRFAEPVSDVQRLAIDRLLRADRRLGEVGAQLVRRVLGDRMSIAKAAALQGVTAERDVRQIGARFRECLDTLVRVTDVVAEGRRPALRTMEKHTVQTIVEAEQIEHRLASMIKNTPQKTARDNRDAAAAAAGHAKKTKRRRA